MGGDYTFIQGYLQDWKKVLLSDERKETLILHRFRHSTLKSSIFDVLSGVGAFDHKLFMLSIKVELSV